MNVDNDAKLVAAFPELYWQRGMDMMQTAMCWGFDCGDGWFDLIWKLSEKISPFVKKFNEQQQIEFDELLTEEKESNEPAVFGVVQVKEKFGGLRYYTNYYTEEIQDIIDECEDRSYTICEDCGSPGEIRNTSWIQTLCDEHYKKYVDRTQKGTVGEKS